MSWFCFFLWLASCVDLPESKNWLWNHSALSQQQQTSCYIREGLGFGGQRAQQSSYELLSQLKLNLEKVTGNFYHTQDIDYFKKRHWFRQTGAVRDGSLNWFAGLSWSPSAKGIWGEKWKILKWWVNRESSNSGSRLKVWPSKNRNAKSEERCTKGCWSTSSP